MAVITLGDYINDCRTRPVHMKDFYYSGVLTDDYLRSYVYDDSILIPYENALRTYLRKITFTDAELRKYRYNPWRFALDTYGSSEYWFLVLHANEMYSAAEFCNKENHFYTTSVLQFLNEISACEDKFLRRNEAEVDKFMNNLPAKLNVI